MTEHIVLQLPGEIPTSYPATNRDVTPIVDMLIALVTCSTNIETYQELAHPRHREALGYLILVIFGVPESIFLAPDSIEKSEMMTAAVWGISDVIETSPGVSHFQNHIRALSQDGIEAVLFAILSSFVMSVSGGRAIPWNLETYSSEWLNA